MTTTDKLPPMQAAFVGEYLLDLNASGAARRAGYSEKTADVQGPRLLGNVRVAEAIQQALNKRAERTEISADWVLLRLVENVDRSMQAVQVLDRKGVPTGEYRYEGAVANRGLELIGKHLGMFVGPKGDDNASEILDAFTKLFSGRKESGDGRVIDVEPNEQPGSVRALVDGGGE